MKAAAFVAAVIDPNLAVPDGFVDARGRPAGRRFDVYRNNVVSGLTGVLEAGFPVVRRLVGEPFFAAMAGEFLRWHLPQSRIMMLYGEAFPDFLQEFGPVAHLGYLPDVARLEMALRRSYHAADSPRISAEQLATIVPAVFSQIRLHLSPAVFVLPSR